MKVEFLKQFNNDAKKISVQKVRNEVIKVIENAVNKKIYQWIKKTIRL